MKLSCEGPRAAGQILSEQYALAVQALRNCAHPAGLNASAYGSGHQQVWARDSMISLLGGALVADRTVQSALEASIETLERHQAPSGCIPSNVDPVTGRPNFRAYADSGLWFVIGSSILSPRLDAVRRVLRWYECQDVDQSGLISMQEASDWQDLFCTRGKGLYVNCLYVLALQKAAAMARSAGDEAVAAGWLEQSRKVSQKIHRLFWYAPDRGMRRHIEHSFSTDNIEHDSLGRRRWIPTRRVLPDEEYYLPYLGFREVGEWFDSLGNLLAILSGVAGEDETARILDLMDRYNIAGEPVKAIYPAVQPGEPDWRDYYGSLNLPHHYHNGGIWPFIGGFYVAALVKAGRLLQAEAALERLAHLNAAGDFNEWHHGQTVQPMGVAGQAWSAGMYLFACECVRRRSVPLL